MLEVKWKCEKCKKVHISSFELETFANITKQEYVGNKFKLQCKNCGKENDFELSLKQMKESEV